MAKAGAAVRIFLLGDGVTAALSGLNPAHADYHPQEMLTFLFQRGAQIAVCRTCLEMRGIPDASLIAGASRSTMDELVSWTEESDKVLVF
jgi:sulfur relay (sulfurtransferase) complex TusBCD TusD component (DsrE family)